MRRRGAIIARLARLHNCFCLSNCRQARKKPTTLNDSDSNRVNPPTFKKYIIFPHNDIRRIRLPRGLDNISPKTRFCTNLGAVRLWRLRPTPNLSSRAKSRDLACSHRRTRAAGAPRLAPFETWNSPAPPSSISPSPFRSILPTRTSPSLRPSVERTLLSAALSADALSHVKTKYSSGYR